MGYSSMKGKWHTGDGFSETRTKHKLADVYNFELKALEHYWGEHWNRRTGMKFERRHAIVISYLKIRPVNELNKIALNLLLSDEDRESYVKRYLIKNENEMGLIFKSIDGRANAIVKDEAGGIFLDPEEKT